MRECICTSSSPLDLFNYRLAVNVMAASRPLGAIDREMRLRLSSIACRRFAAVVLI